MNSWQTLLLLDMNRGRYVSRRVATQYEWLMLWGLATQGLDAWALGLVEN